jgi:hypothetical protein
MATIVRRPGKNGQTSYRAQVRRKGAAPLSATFTTLSDARKWVQVTEAAIIEGRHFKTAETKRHTLVEDSSGPLRPCGHHTGFNRRVPRYTPTRDSQAPRQRNSDALPRCALTRLHHGCP